jgi:hypothetical protein
MYSLSDEVKEIMLLFPSSFINSSDELILEPKNNIYFRLDNVKNELELKCKFIEYTSRASCKGLSLKQQKLFRDNFNKYFNTDFDVNEMTEIYTYLGGGVNRGKCIKFIESGFDLSILKLK